MDPFPIEAVERVYDSFVFRDAYDLEVPPDMRLFYVFAALNPRNNFARPFLLVALRPKGPRNDMPPGLARGKQIWQDMILPLMGSAAPEYSTNIYPVLVREHELRAFLEENDYELVDYYTELERRKKDKGGLRTILRYISPLIRVSSFRKSDNPTKESNAVRCLTFENVCLTHIDMLHTMPRRALDFWTEVFDSYYHWPEDIEHNRAALNLYAILCDPDSKGRTWQDELDRGPKIGQLFKRFREGFTDAPRTKTLVLEINEPLPSQTMRLIDNATFFWRKFEFKWQGKLVQGIRIRTGDILRLRNQSPEIRNGDYMMCSPNVGTTGLKVTWNPERMKINRHGFLEFSYKGADLECDPRDLRKRGDIKFWLHVIGPPVETWASSWEDTSLTGPILRVDSKVLIAHMTPDRTRYEELYKCLVDDSAQTEAQCRQVQDAPWVWDRKCMSDFECPFFTPEEEEYGCTGNGYCRMPLNVESRGFRYWVESEDSWPIIKRSNQSFSLIPLRRPG